MKKWILYIALLLFFGSASKIFGQCDNAVGGLLVASDTLQCVSESTTLTLSGSVGSITWVTRLSGVTSWSPLSATGSTSITVTPEANSEYAALVLDDVEPCTATSNIVTIQVSSFTEIPKPGFGDDGICGNKTIPSATSSGQSKEYWSLSYGSGEVNFYPDSSYANSDSAIVTEYGIYGLAWNISDGVCTKDSIVEFTFKEVPVANAGIDTNICGGSFQLAAEYSIVGSTGQWTKSSTGIFNFLESNNPKTNVNANPGTHTIKWEETYNGCSNSEIIIVEVASQPVANAGLGGVECDKTFNLNAAFSSYFGVWSQVSGLGVVSFDNSNSYITTATTTDYGENFVLQWKLVNSFCSDSDTINVDFFEQPNANAGSYDDICGPNTILTANPSLGTQQWSNYLNASDATISNSDNYTTTVNVNGNYGSYSFIWQETNDICVDSDTITFTFYEQPISNAGSDASVCGLVNNLAAIPSVGAGLWTYVSDDGTAHVTTPSSAVSTFNVSDYGVYLFKWKEVSGICADSSEVSQSFFEQPEISILSDFDNCGDTTRLSATKSVGNGLWSKESGSGTAIFSNAESANTLVKVNSYGPYVFKWMVDNGGCSDSLSVNVLFIESPETSAGENETICGNTYQLDGSDSKFNGVWYMLEGVGAANYTPNNTSPKAEVEVNSFGDYYFIWKETNGKCVDSSGVRLKFIDQPIANAGSDQELDNVFETSLLAEDLNADYSGSWTVVNGDGYILINSDPSTQISNLALGETQVEWMVSNGLCIGVDTVAIIVYDIFIPDVITPNNDGDNDYFVIRGIDDATSVELSIFNRWGIEVYYSDNYQNDWNGVNKSGNDLTNDTYFYLLTVNNSRILKGYVVIKR